MLDQVGNQNVGFLMTRLKLKNLPHHSEKIPTFWQSEQFLTFYGCVKMMY